MTAYYDGTTGRGVLEGDNVGWSRVKYALPTAPSGTNQAIYVMRYWFDSFGSNTTFSSLTWEASAYHGFKFDGTHVPTNYPVATETGYDNFFGFAASNLADASKDDQIGIDSGNSENAGWYGATDTTGWHEFYNANGGSTGLSANLSGQPLGVPRDQTLGTTYTFVWLVNGSQVDDSVNYEIWTNKGSLNLDTFNLATDLDPNDPQSSIVPSATAVTGSLQGDVNGTNWRPSAGVMDFPTYFMARYPGSNQSFIIDYLGVQYSQI